jgi:hypothetical protein
MKVDVIGGRTRTISLGVSPPPNAGTLGGSAIDRAVANPTLLVEMDALPVDSV